MYPNQQDPYNQQAQYGSQDQALGAHAYELLQSQAVSSFFTRVYGMMLTALAATAVTAFTVSQSEGLMTFFSTGIVPWVMLGVYVLACFTMMPALSKMPAALGTMLFYAFAVMLGAMLSGIFLMYDMASVIAPTFFVCAAMFAGLSVFGMTTKKDLGPVGTAAYMIFIGVILLSLVNVFFLHSSGLALMISYGIVVLISIITAYDTQKLRQFVLAQDPTAQSAHDREITNRVAIMGAFTLFLDFIILFIHMLRIVASASRD